MTSPNIQVPVPPGRVVKELLSPKQVARAIGVSESSLKRWCDQGLIETVRTGGGHRKLPLHDVVRFLRERHHNIAHPELLGLPARSEQSDIGIEQGRQKFTQALLEGNEPQARQIVFDLFLAKHSISVICDEVLTAAFQEICQRWACDSADVYQARRSCEYAQRILYELRRTLPAPDPEWKACGGSLEGDHCTLPSTVTELVLLDSSWDATSLGTSIPAVSMVRAIETIKPKLFWLCASQIDDVEKFVRDFKLISDAAEAARSAIAVGGRALTEEIRKRMKFCCYWDTMQHLESFSFAVREYFKSNA